MKHYFFVTLLIFILVSCKNQSNNEEFNSYQIITLLYKELSKPLELPLYPPPIPNGSTYKRNLTAEDTINYVKLRNKFLKERNARKQIVCIPAIYNNVFSDMLNLDNKCGEFEGLVEKLESIKIKKEIDIDKIKSRGNDSIIYFKESLIPQGRKDYETFDVLVSFSNIAFNEDFTNAVVIGSTSTSKLAGVSILYYLEKIDNNWIVVCEEGLSMS